MRRALPIALVLALLAFLLPAATTPTERLPARFEALAIELETLFVEILGASDSEPVFKSHGQGLYSMTLALSEEQKERFVTQSAAVKMLTVLSNGNCASTPTSPRTLISAVMSSTDINYNFWFVAVNISNSSKVRKTINTIKGPGLNFRRVDNLLYPDSAIQTYWFERRDAFSKDGIFTFKTKISTAGAVKGKSFAM